MSNQLIHAVFLNVRRFILFLKFCQEKQKICMIVFKILHPVSLCVESLNFNKYLERENIKNVNVVLQKTL